MSLRSSALRRNPPPAYLNRINGQPTIRLIVHKEKGTSTLKVARDVKLKLEEVKREVPRDLIFRVVDDESKEIHKSLKELYLLVGIIWPLSLFLCSSSSRASSRPS